MPELHFKGKEFVYNHHLTVPFRPLATPPAPAGAWCSALAEFEHGLIRERTLAGLSTARTRGRKGGRNLRLSKADVRKAAAMLADPKITKAGVAQRFAVSRVTLNAALTREGFGDLPVAAPETTAPEARTQG